jgi:hypothetical protein
VLCYFKVYPKFMAVTTDKGCLCVRLRYAVEQYGVMIGPLDIHVRLQPDELARGADPWEILSNTRERHNRLFDRFFVGLETFLSQEMGIRPFEEVRLGQRKLFEMYFPELHYDCGERAWQ